MDKHTLKFVIAGAIATLSIMCFMVIYETILLNLSAQQQLQLLLVDLFFFTFFSILTVPVGLYWARPFFKLVEVQDRGEIVDEEILMDAQNAAMRFPAKMLVFMFVELTLSVAGVFIILWLYHHYSWHVLSYLTIVNFLTMFVVVVVIYCIFKIVGRNYVEAIMSIRSKRELKRHDFRLSLFTKISVFFFVLVLYFVSLSLIMGYNRSLRALENQLAEGNTFWVNEVAKSIRMNHDFDIDSLSNLPTGKYSKLLIIKNGGQILMKPEGSQANNIIEPIRQRLRQGDNEGSGLLKEIDTTFSFKVIAEQGLVVVSFAQVKLKQSHSNRMIKTALMIIIGSMLLCLLISIFLANDINYPLKKIISYIDDITRNVHRDSLDALTEDEFSDLIFSVLEMKQGLDSHKRRTEELLNNISDTVMQQDETTRMLGELSKDQAGGSSRQNVAAKEALSASEEIVAKASEIAQSASSVYEVATKTMKACENSTTLSEFAALEMSRLREEVSDILSKTGALEEAGSAINDIAEIIKEISDQTQLLALNASLQASGAGEAGKRFGVVAGEVGQLAAQTADAAQQITQFTNSIVEDIEVASQAASNSYRTAGETEEMISEVKNALDTISAYASETTVASQEITYSTRQQTSASEQMTQTIGRVSEVANNTENTVGELENTAEGIKEITIYLKKLMENAARV